VLGCRAVHLQPGQLAELEQGGPYTPRCTVDEDMLAAADVGNPVQRRVRGLSIS
jgi:hypothetical protein